MGARLCANKYRHDSRFEFQVRSVSRACEGSALEIGPRGCKTACRGYGSYAQPVDLFVAGLLHCTSYAKCNH